MTRKPNAMPACKFTQAVDCDLAYRGCDKCGWNPKVAAARVQKCRCKRAQEKREGAK